MAIVRQICTDALMEIGATGQGETPSASDIITALRYFQRQLDAWLADRLTLAVQKRVTFTLTSGDTTVTIGPAGGDITNVRPVWLDAVTYVDPGSSPSVEVPIAIMNSDQYAALSIKDQTSSLPLSVFYQTSTDTVLGSLFFWPTVTQNVGIVLYYPSGVAIPAALDDVLLGPPGYHEAYVYQLALRLLTPFGRKVQDLPMLPELAREAYARMKRPNTQPGLLGVDAALIPSIGGAYNVYSDTSTGST